MDPVISSSEVHAYVYKYMHFSATEFNSDK